MSRNDSSLSFHHPAATGIQLEDREADQWVEDAVYSLLEWEAESSSSQMF